MGHLRFRFISLFLVWGEQHIAKLQLVFVIQATTAKLRPNGVVTIYRSKCVHFVRKQKIEVWFLEISPTFFEPIKGDFIQDLAVLQYQSTTGSKSYLIYDILTWYTWDNLRKLMIYDNPYWFKEVWRGFLPLNQNSISILELIVQSTNLSNKLLPHLVEISLIILLPRYSDSPDYSDFQCPDQHVVQVNRTKICENKQLFGTF